MTQHVKTPPAVYTDSGTKLTTCEAAEVYFSTLSKSSLGHEMALANKEGQIRIELKSDGTLHFEKTNIYFDEGNHFHTADSGSSTLTDNIFDAEMLPPGVREFAIDSAYRMDDAPLEFSAASAVMTLSAAIGRRVLVRPKIKGDFSVTPNLWGALIAPPSVKKSPLYKEAIKPLMKAEKQKFEEHKEAFAKYKNTLIEYKIALKKYEKSIGENKVVTIPKEPIEPKRTRYVTQDTTIEALAEILIDNPNGILNTVDELSGFLASLEKPGREGDRAFYVEAFGGDEPKSIDRISRGAPYLPKTCVSIFGTIQPDKIAPLIRNTNGGISGGDGLLQRFQLMVMVNKPRFNYVDQKPDQKAIQEYSELIYSLLNSDPQELGAQYDEFKDEIYYRFSIEASKQFKEWSKTNNKKINELIELNPALAAHLGKYSGLFSSIALIFFYADKVRGLVNENSIPEKYALMAWKWCDYLEDQAKNIYDIDRITEERRTKIEEKVINKVRELEMKSELPLSYGKIAGKIRHVNADQCRFILKGIVVEKHKKVFGLK